MQPHPQYAPVPQLPAKRKRAVPLFVAILMTAGALLIGGLFGGAIGAAGAGATAAGATVAPTSSAPASTSKLAAKPAATTPAAPPKPAVKPAATIEDGVWTVGDDVPAGAYKVTAAVSEGCYWSITKSGTNGSDIIDNALPKGGVPRVTLKKGQDFETNRCGTWRKL
jgi:hypothetical protein